MSLKIERTEAGYQATVQVTVIPLDLLREDPNLETAVSRLAFTLEYDLDTAAADLFDRVVTQGVQNILAVLFTLKREGWDLDRAGAFSTMRALEGAKLERRIALALADICTDLGIEKKRKEGQATP